ncbi:MAG: ABC transporter permease subunit [Ignavibacterium sp.]|uniref:ABC transporter permease subunit n=1 Tax=Ignavibacterium sp. TaxID=2651167 RepID=UPI00404A9FB4
MNSKNFKIILAIITVYLILFEFIFPSNKILPSASVIWLSTIELFDKYNFLMNLLSTLSAVYISILFNYLMMKILFPFSQVYLINSSDKNFISFITFIPFFFISLIFVFWLPEFILTKYIVTVVVFFLITINELLSQGTKESMEYYDFYKSLGLKETTIKNKILFKLKEPKYFYSQLKNHSLIWSVVLIVEFLQQQEGVGNILRIAFKYQDISITFTITIFISLTVYFLDFAFKKLYNKIYFWK